MRRGAPAMPDAEPCLVSNQNGKFIGFV
ncbi:hypothetical protein BCEN4_910020 [Burkholderia cenocepacia]|nr:hypothetical protein BCEN4_910020 [Burkholderia cenocepacia]